MSLADLSIKRPVFVTCVTLLLFAVGLLSMGKLGVDLFPDVTFPVVTVSTPYRGAGPQEIETLVTRPIEDELSTLSGIKRLTSINQEGVSVVVAEFLLEVDVKVAEQQVRDRVGSVRRNLPDDVEEPVIRRIDPSDQAIVYLALQSSLPDGQLYDLANETIRPRLEQVNQVGLVDILGGRKREIHVDLDRKKLKDYEVAASQVARRIAAAGENIPAGKVEEGPGETVIRTMAEFKSLDEIKGVVVNFFGNDVPVKVGQLGTITDTLVDKKNEVYTNGEKSLFLNVFKQSGANTIKVVDGVLARVDQINADFKTRNVDAKIIVVRDGSMWIRWNILDVQESILLGILLAVIVVYFFLGSMRSTVITGLALPNSLIGAFVLMALAGFTINVMSLLALSLSVGLLIDDAIVVRENIFRHLEMGKSTVRAALEGTGEVRLAVIATTLTVIAVFGPVGFIDGVIGQFLKEFGLTVCFAMAISLFDALTIAPMLSAYFAGSSHSKPTTVIGRVNERMLKAFDCFQASLENIYEAFLQKSLRRPATVLFLSFVLFVAMMSLGVFVPKTFLPAQDGGEFTVRLELPSGASLEAMSEKARVVDAAIRRNKEVEVSALTVGNKDGEANVASVYVRLVLGKDRAMNTSQFKDILREQLTPYKELNPRIVDFDAVGGGQRPFNINIIGSNQEDIEKVAYQLFERLKKDARLKDVDIDYRPGKPEFRVQLDLAKMETLGVGPLAVGEELRTQLEGVETAKFREKGVEYEVRVRLQPDQRNLKRDFSQIVVPNLNQDLIPLKAVSTGEEAQGPAKITRQDRGRYIQVNADITPGAGMGDVMTDIAKWFEADMKPPAGVSYAFVGQAENFKEMGAGMAIAFGLGILFIYLVLASLYESFVTPFTIMLALPLAICGSIVALAIARESLNLFSMLGLVMLLGVASKNSILLVDHAMKRIREGEDFIAAIIDAGRVRLRPILMTTMALIAGSIPIAIGLNEASKQRTSMGVGIIGGLISSTILTLIVIPSAFILVERIKAWVFSKRKHEAPLNVKAEIAAFDRDQKVKEKEIISEVKTA